MRPSRVCLNRSAVRNCAPLPRRCGPLLILSSFLLFLIYRISTLLERWERTRGSHQAPLLGESNVRVVSFSGSASRQVSPDEATVTFSISAFDANLIEATKKNHHASKTSIDVRNIGVQIAETQTIRF